MRLTHALVSLRALFAAHLVIGCSDDSHDCHTYSTCPDGGGTTGAGASGKSSGGTHAGGDSGGSSSGQGGAGASGGSSNLGGAGEGGSEAGAGGTPITLPCGGTCTGDKPVCKESTDTCVQCLTPSDCTTDTKTKCDTASNSCVECLASTDCGDAMAAKCDKGACVKCTSNDDCAHVAGKTVCDTAAGECVECTGKDYASCGMDMGAPLVCDSLQRSCTTDKEHGADLCRPCVSDAHCPTGQACVKEKFGAPVADVGYFCFWKQGDTAEGAPANCLNAKPYASTLSNQMSIDGATIDVCALGSSTCIARNQLADAKDCSTGNAADNSKCGFAPGIDSKCVDKSGGFRCTMACASSDDCPGNLACDGTSFCKL